MQELEGLCRKAWRAYEFLRDTLVQESSTSRLLHERFHQKIIGRLCDELGELRGAVEGTHTHPEHPEVHPVVLEASQVWYWSAVLGVYERHEYNIVRPHAAVEAGYRSERPLVPPSRSDMLVVYDGQDRITEALRFMGHACRLKNATPEDVITYDLKQMESRPYLKGLV